VACTSVLTERRFLFLVVVVTLQSSSSQLSHLEQLITLLMINKKHIVSSDQMRKEVIPKLNILQIKQVLAMYTPTGTFLAPQRRHTLTLALTGW
jgi:hypothetical protein